MPTLEGQCLCGGVTVRLPAPTYDVGACHCARCRRWGSGPWLSFQVPSAVVSGKTLRVFRSSPFAERGFCETCGTHIFHRPQDGPELAVNSGLFPPDSLYIAREIFADTKPAYYPFAADSVRRSTNSMAAEWLPKLLWRRLRKLAGSSAR